MKKVCSMPNFCLFYLEIQWDWGSVCSVWSHDYGSGTKEQVDAELKDKVLLDFDPV